MAPISKVAIGIGAATLRERLLYFTKLRIFNYFWLNENILGWFQLSWFFFVHHLIQANQTGKANSDAAGQTH